MRARRRDVLAVLAAACLTSACNDPPPAGDAGAGLPDPVAVIERWNDTRNQGEVASALALPADGASVLGYRLVEPGDRAELAEILAAQAEAGFHRTDHGCAATGLIVTCEYEMNDGVMRRWNSIREHVQANLRRLVLDYPHLAPWQPLLAATGACRLDGRSSA